MRRLVKGIPFLLACLLAYTIFRVVGEDPPHITQQKLNQLQANHPKGVVATVASNDNLLQYEAYGPPSRHQYRIQALKPGTVEFYNADGKPVMKMFIESGDVLITVPDHQTIEAYDFEPFEWLE